MGELLEKFKQALSELDAGSFSRDITENVQQPASSYSFDAPAYDDPEEQAIIDSRIKTGGELVQRYSLMQKQQQIEALRLKKRTEDAAKKNLAGRSEFTRGLLRGIDTLQATYEGGIGMYNAAMGDQAAANQRFANYQEQMRQAQENPATVTDFFSTDPKTGAFASPGNFGTYVAGTLGQAVPSLTEAVASGIAGAAIGAAIVPAPDPSDVVTIPAGAIGGFLGRNAMKRAIASAAQQYAQRGVAQDVAEQMADRYVRQAVANRIATNIGSGLAVSQTTALHEGGGMYAEGLEKGYSAPGTAIALGQFSGLSESLFGAAPTAVKAIIGKAAVDEVAKDFGWKTAAGYLWETIKGAGEEGVQEGFQELLGSINQEINDPNFKINSKETFMQWAEAAAAGAVTGGVVGGGGAGLQAIRDRKRQLEQIRAKGFVSESDAKQAGIDGASRRDRMANLEAERQDLDRQEQEIVGQQQVDGMQVDESGQFVPQVSQADIDREFAERMAAQGGNVTTPAPALLPESVQPPAQQNPFEVPSVQTPQAVPVQQAPGGVDTRGFDVYGQQPSQPSSGNPFEFGAGSTPAGVSDVPASENPFEQPTAPSVEPASEQPAPSLTPEQQVESDRQFAEQKAAEQGSIAPQVLVIKQRLKNAVRFAPDTVIPEGVPSVRRTHPVFGDYVEVSTAYVDRIPGYSADIESQGAGMKPSEQQPAQVEAPEVPVVSSPEQHAALPMYGVYETTFRGKKQYAVKSFDKGGFGDSLFDSLEEARKNSENEIRRANDISSALDAADAAAKDEAKKKADYEASFKGFLSTDPKTKGRQLKVLGGSRQYNGKVVTVKDLIEQKVAGGAVVNASGQLESPDGAYLGSDKITKIGVDYARHLLASRTEAETPGKPDSIQSLEFNIGQGARPIPGMESDEANYTVLKRKPDVIPDTFKVVISGKPFGKGWLSVDGTGTTGEEAYRRAFDRYMQKRPGELRDKTRKADIRRAIEEQGGFENNSADDVEAIRRKLYDGADTPTGTEIRAVMDEMKVEASRKLESEQKAPESEPQPAPQGKTEAFRSLPEKSRSKFEELWNADDTSIKDILDKTNKNLRAEFEARTGLTLPKTKKGTAETVEKWHAEGRKTAYEKPSAEAEAPSDADAVESEPSAFEKSPQAIPAYVISGQQRSPMRIGQHRVPGSPFFGRPVGVAVGPSRMSENAIDQVAAHVNAGGMLFVDSGMFGTVTKMKPGSEPNWESVFNEYARILDKVDPDKQRNVMLVMPDYLVKLESGLIIGDARKTLDLQREYSDKAKDILNRGARIIIPLQKDMSEVNPLQLSETASLASDNIDLDSGNYAWGIPYNEAAWSDEEILDLVRANLKVEGEMHLHLLGGGKARAEKLWDKIRAIDPTVKLTGDAATEARNLSRKPEKEAKPSEAVAAPTESPAPSKLLDKLESIEELRAVLENWSADDKRPKSSYSLKELIELAKSRLQDFKLESGNELAEDLAGQNGEDAKKYAISQRNQIKAWIQVADSEDTLQGLENDRAFSESFIKIVADDVSKIRKQDIYRLLSEVPNERAGYFENWLSKRRPDLANEITTASNEILLERSKKKQSEPPAEGEMSVEDFVSGFVGGFTSGKQEKTEKPKKASVAESVEQETQYLDIKQHAVGITRTIRAEKGGKSLLIEQERNRFNWSIREVGSKQDIVSGISELKRAKAIAERVFAGTFDKDADLRFVLNDPNSLSYSNQRLAGLWDGRTAESFAATLVSTGYYTDGRMLVKLSDKDRDAVLKKAGTQGSGRIANIDAVIAPSKQQSSYKDNEMSVVGYRGGERTPRVVMLKNKIGDYVVLDKAYHDTVMKRHPTAKIWGSSEKRDGSITKAVLYEVDGEAVAVVMPMTVEKVDKYLSAMIEGKYDATETPAQPEAPPAKKPKSLKKEPKQGVREGLDKAKEGAKLFIEGIKDATKGTTPFANIPMNEKIARGLGMMAEGLIEAGKYKFVDFIDSVVELVGVQNARNYARYLEAGWSEIGKTDSRLDKPQSVLKLLEEKANEVSDFVSPQIKIARKVVSALENGEALTSQSFFSIADDAFGGTRANNDYGDSEATDALELGVNMYLQGKTNANVQPEQAKAILEQIRGVMQLVPRHRGRTGNKDVMQQFSTPPAYAYAINWIAGITREDVVLEPSAGMGGLAIHAANSGATVYANELDKARASGLKSLPLEKVFTEDAEQIGAILAEKTPGLSVVIMNPPFSRAGTRMGNKMIQGTDRKHIEEALRLLPEGGRLVAIVGAGLHGQGQKMTQWLESMPYKLTANIEVARDVYRGYGTEFPTRVLVIDKMPRAGTKTIAGVAGDLDQLIDIATEVRNARPDANVERDSVKQDGKQGTRQDESEPRPSDDVRDAIDARVPQQQPAGQAQPGQPASDRGDGDADARTSTGTAGGDAGRRRGGGVGGRSSRKSVRTSEKGGLSVAATGKLDDVRRSGLTKFVAKGREKDSKKKGELTESTFEVYVPSIAIEGAKPHPAPIVESAAMAAVDAPKIEYEVDLMPGVFEGYVNDDGLYVGLSDIQLEAIALAGAAQEKLLASGERRGFLIGDGTGVGKAREALGIIMDDLIKRGTGKRRKAVFITKNDGLVKDAVNEWVGVGGDAAELHQLSSVSSGETVGIESGVLTVSYDTLKGLASAQAVSAGKKLSRVDQIVDWVGEDFDGVIVFDEAHLMANSLDSGQGNKLQKASQRAVAGVDLQKRLPNARFVYLSATAATEVRNLAYAERLGLWGPGTEFVSKRDFINEIEAGGVAAMEKVAADMKAMGMYIARNLSYDDGTENGKVEFDRILHTLSDDQRRIYDKLSEAWLRVLKNIDVALDITENQKGKSRIVSAFWSSNQRFWNDVIASMMAPTLIKNIEKDLKDGKSVVLQLYTTKEAATNRAIAGMLEGQTYDEIDASPRRALMEFVEKSFPVQRYEEYLDESGNVRNRPVVDSEGKAVNDPQAVAMKEKLLDEIGSLDVASRGPIDMILDHFGRDSVAEVSGRSQRLVKNSEGSLELEKRSKASSRADREAFMNGRKRILVFSEAGGTGASYHASLSSKNQQRRSHYLWQPGWSATTAVQGLGRAHRSNQASAPQLHLLEPNLEGYKRFISTVARRLAQLGALTKGQRTAADAGLFSPSDNLESTESSRALSQFLDDAIAGKIDGIDKDFIVNRLGFEQFLGVGANTDSVEIPQFLNRILNLPLGEQNKVFQAFMTKLDAIVSEAVASGTLDQGMETLKALRVVKNREIVVNEHLSGAKTKLVELTVTKAQIVVSFDEMMSQRERYGSYKPRDFVISKTSGKIFAVMDQMRISQDEKGKTTRDAMLIGVNGNSYGFSLERFDNTQYWEKVSDIDKVRNEWNRQFSASPKTVDIKWRLLTGALLPVWRKIVGYERRVWRTKTEDGEMILGRHLPEDTLSKTLENLGVGEGEQATPKNIPSKEAMQAVYEGHSLELVNGWQIKKRTIDGQDNIEIIGPDYSSSQAIADAGGFSRRIDYKTRFFVPFEDTEGLVLSKIAKLSPIKKIAYKDSSGGSKQNLDKGLRNPPDVLYQTEPDIDATIRSKALDLGIAANKQGITQFDDFIAYAVDKIGEAQTRRLGNYLTMVGQSVGMKGVRPTKDVLGVPMTQEQYVQLAKETFASVPAEQVEAGIEAAMLVLPQAAVGFAPAGSPVPGQGLMQGDFDQPADYEFTEGDYRPAVVTYARDKWGSEVAANGKPTWQNFVRWFDDSAVVDRDGKPLVVYHGGAKTIDDNIIRTPFFYMTANKDEAQSIYPDATLHEFYVKMSNPHQAGEHLDNFMDWREYAKDLKENGDVDFAEELLDSTGEALTLMGALKARGNDGIIMPGEVDERYKNYLAFNPSQIKSATANVGTFDPSNPNMLYQNDLSGIDAESIPKTVLDKMSRRLKSMGYDSRGAEDVRKAIKEKRLLDFQEDWIAAYRFAVGAEQDRQGRAKAKKDLKHINWNRLSQLGETLNPNEAGYIKPDGSLADFSGKREGGQPGMRSFDHREAGGTAGMQEVIAYGWVRMDENSGSLDIAKMPTPAQLSAITRMAQRKFGEIVLDLEDGLGEWRETDEYYSNPLRRWSQQYPEGTKPQRIINDIKRFFGGDTPNTLYQRAYHGSPYKFSKFTLDHIGKGEGAQMYGWGLYFADKRQVADYYREMLAKPFVRKWTIGSIPMVRTDRNGNAQYYDYSPRTSKDSDIANAAVIEEILVNQIHIESAFAESGLKSAKAKTKKIVENQIETWKDEWPEAVEHAERFIKEIDRKFEMEIESPGAVYQVEIPESEDYLLWDKPMTQQSEKVKDALRGVKPEDLGLRFSVRNASGAGVYVTARKEQIGKQVDSPVNSILDLFGDATGMTLYFGLVNQRGVPQTAAERWASEFLAKRGVKGIKYLDQNSRFATADEKSFNYVIFDASDIVMQEALFQQQAQGGNVKGWTKFISGTRALIGATSKADISTVIHEFAHPIRRFLLDKSVPQNKRFDITNEEIDMLADKCGVKNGNWDVEAEEKFARMWEQYWFEGKSPNSVLDSLFAKISRWMQQVYSSITAITGQPLDPEVRKLFDKLVQRGLTPDQRAAGKKSGGGTAAPVTTSDDPWKQRLTSIVNQVVELIRLRLGVPGLTEPSAETFKQWLDEAKQILSNDPTYAERLVKELAQSNRNVDNIDVAVLQIHFRHLNNQLEAASDRLFKAKEEKDSVAAAKARLDTDLLVNQIEEFTDITKRAGTEAGRALVARKIALQSDFTLGSLLRKARIANAGEELSKDQISEMTELSKKIAELEGQLEKEIQKNNDLERRLAAEQSIEDTKKEVGKPVRNTATNRASSGAKKFVGLFASIFGKKTDTGTLQQTEDEKMAEAAVELIQGYVDAGVYTFGDFMARFKRDIGMDVPMSARVAIRKAWDDMKSQGDIPAPEMQEKDSRELRRLARSIQRSVVEAGIVDPDEVIAAVHESLQEVIEDITTRETMDAMSGYGQFYPASKDLNDKIIRDLNSQYQQMAKLDDMRQGMAPKRTGSERPEPSPEVRDLIRQVNEMKRSSKYFVTDEETQLKTIFQATRTALKNRIYDLDKAIREKDPIPGRTPNTFKGEQAEEIERLRKQRDELMATYKATFPKPGLTFEQRAAIAERAADRAIAEIEKEIASGKLSVKGRAEPISTPALNAKLARLDALKAARDAAFESQIKDREKERAEKAYIANLLNRIADYEDRKQHGYFGPRPKKPPRDLSPREKELSKQLENIKDEFFRYAAEYRLKNMTPVQRAWDYTKETMHLSRAIMTSFDLSAVFRQGGIASFAHPKLAASSAKEMYYALRDGQEEFNTMDKISKDELYAIAMQAGLSITTDSGKITRQEEAYMGRWAKWGIGKKGTKINKLTRGALIPVSASARAYTTFLNSMRFRLFKHMVSNLGAGGQVTLDEAKVIASYVNAATGRAELGKFNQAAANLNMVFFAPRYVASRFQYLAMPFYLLPSSKVSGRVKKMIAMEYARFAIGVTSMLGLSVLLGSMLTDDEEEKPTVEFDPRSSDFMKLKIGETRIDPMAGLSQTVTLIGQLATGQKKGLRGDIQDLYGEKRKFGDPDLWDVTTGFLRKKLAPIPGAIVDLRVGENVIGEKETPLTTGLDLFVPLSFQEAGETFQARGLVGGAGVVALSLLGMGGGTYGPRTAYATGDSKKREELFKKDLERVKWDSPDPAYKDFLTTEQLNKFNKQREGRKQALVYAASADPKRKEYVSDESFKQSVAERDKALDAVIKAGMGYEEIKQLLIGYYKRNYGSAYETRGGNYQMKESLTNRLRAIRRKMNEKQPAKT